jgi:hypothetical protein
VAPWAGSQELGQRRLSATGATMKERFGILT